MLIAIICVVIAIGIIGAYYKPCEDCKGDCDACPIRDDDAHFP